MKSSKSATPSMNHSNEAIDDNYDEENTNTSSSTVDFSLLRKPIVTSVTGFSEAKKAYDSGTEEVIAQFLPYFDFILMHFFIRFENCWPTNVISYTNAKYVATSFVHSSISYHTNVSIAPHNFAQIIIFILVTTSTL